MRRHFTASQKAQIVLEILKEEKTISQIASERGVHPNQLHRWKAQALGGLPRLFENDHKTEKAQALAYERQVQDVYAEIGKLTTQLAWLKKNLAWTLSRDERLLLLELDNRELPLKTKAELLGLNRTGFYYRPVGPSAQEIAAKHRLAESYTAPPSYGFRRGAGG